MKHNLHHQIYTRCGHKLRIEFKNEQFYYLLRHGDEAPEKSAKARSWN